MKKFFWLAMALIAIVALISHFVHSPDSMPDVNWESAVSPGDLSAAHAFMETDCLGCHTPATGVTRDNCVVCHANDTHILQRQPTAFHADVAECASCHKEHKGKLASISQMDHEALVNVGLNMLPDPNVPFDEGTATLAFLESLLANSRKPDPIFVHPDCSAALRAIVTTIVILVYSAKIVCNVTAQGNGHCLSLFIHQISL